MKKFFTGKVKLILAAALCLAIVLAVIGAVTRGATAGEKAAGTLLSPLRSGAAAVAGRWSAVRLHVPL